MWEGTMRGLKLLRDAQERMARQALGMHPYGSRLNRGAMQTQGYVADLIAAPLETADYVLPQDPATGEFYFMVDISTVPADGDTHDPIM
jgi:hypothetical protein